MAKYEAVLFDFDGTICDTFPGISEAMNLMLGEIKGESHELEYYKDCVGPPLEESFTHKFLIPESELERAVLIFRSFYQNTSVPGSSLYEGMRECLESLKRAGLRLAVASSKANDMIERILRHNGLFELFDAVCGLTSEKDHASKTECIERALAALGMSGEAERKKALMVGDRFYDAEGAENAGLDFCAALYAGYYREGEFDPYPCAFEAQSALDIAGFALG
ncbi:MAG: HAD hydrolase-like protein [Oscillospiraceae bacterium]|nr:HAD hydrolase-like protein [Oscillospiraceae bacterium]